MDRRRAVGVIWGVLQVGLLLAALLVAIIGAYGLIQARIHRRF